MTEEQLKMLAELTIANCSLTHQLVSNIRGLTEQLQPLLQERPGEISLLHDLEQLEAVCSESKAAVEQARKFFGLV